MSTKLSKRIAAKLMKRGQSSIRIKPDSVENATKAITSDDVRELISKGSLYAIKKKKNLSAYGKIRRKKRHGGRSRGMGKRKGTFNARGTIEYKQRVRAQRRVLKHLKANKLLNNETFKKYYRLVKGGSFTSKISLVNRIRSDGNPITDQLVEQLRKI